MLEQARDEFVFFDLSFTALLEQIAPRLLHVRGYVALASRVELPDTNLPNLLCYEDLLGAEKPTYDWPVLDENAASTLCYTSGTTGNPKGVLYSHRSLLLHAMVGTAVDGLALSARDTVLLVTPLFHVNAWACRLQARCAALSSCCRGRGWMGRACSTSCRTRAAPSRSVCRRSGWRSWTTSASIARRWT